MLAYSSDLQISGILNGLDHTVGYSDGGQIQNVEYNASFRLNADATNWKLDWLVGGRYLYLADHFNLRGVDALFQENEQLDYQTSNSLLGLQTGLHFAQGWQNFQWDVGVKYGPMLNIYRQHGADRAATALAGFNPYDNSNNSSGLSQLFEVSVGVRVLLSPVRPIGDSPESTWWLHVGYQFDEITGLALAPQQVSGFDHGGKETLNGLSVGVEAAW